MTNWTKVCAASDVPENELRKYDIGDIEVVVANYGGGFRVFPPFCPHMFEPLAVSGMLKDNVLTCGKHLWQWDLATGEKHGLSEKDMLFYDCKEDGGEIHADLSEQLTYDWEEEDELDDDDFFS